EAALHQHSDIRESAVLAVEDAAGQTRLVAYIVPVNQPPPVSVLRQFLAQTLPAYMIPAFFISLDKFPLTPNGKIDRKALPPPTVERPKLSTAYKAPQTRLEQLLASLWQTVLGVDKVGTEDNFFELGGDSLNGAMVINKLQAELGEYLYIVALFEAPTIAELAIYLSRKYPRGVARLTGDDEAIQQEAVERITGADVAQIRGLIRPLAPRRGGPDRTKNPPAIFVLTTPRSGSTLFRVMLAGHPDLYAPPEPDLLLFNTLAERKQRLVGGDAFRLEGTIRALMDIKGDGVEQAKNRMAEYEVMGVTTQAFYRCLQEWVAPRRLVDKSTFYALDLAALKRIEVDFDNALYIHLVRHPYGMIHSFEKVRLDRIFFKDQHRFTVRQIAEITWLICQQNITRFLEMVPPGRHHQIQYEDLVCQPQATMESLCHFLGLDMHPGLLEPYADKTTRMTDGLHAGAEARMLGDVKFHEHQAIDPNIADTWRAHYDADFLGDPTVEMAEALGYELIAQPSTIEAGIRALPRGAESNHTGQVTDDIDDLFAHLSDEEIEELLKQSSD
ncbi:MAG: sulfotransferase, partial [Anaerolineae bacterium]|nr:sulfotransferase [Anaerolineae bacterium]